MVRLARYVLRTLHNAVDPWARPAICILNSILFVGGCVAARTHPVVPREYADERPPPGVFNDAAAISRGRELYEEHCSVCHGDSGNGTGPHALRLVPKPADFTDSSAASRRTPAYMFWRISEGKNAEPYYSRGSSMPAWKQHLTEAEIWQVIAYLYTFANGPPD